MSSTKKKSFSMNLRDVENFFKYRRMPYPKRSAEFIALIAVSCTLFLFMHTKTLNSRLHEMEIKLQPSELSAIGLSASNSIQSGSDSKSDMKGVHGTYQYLKSTGQMSNLSAIPLNNTVKAEMEILFFNRVPKVGSESMMALIKELGRLNIFDVRTNGPEKGIPQYLNLQHQQEFASIIASFQEPSAYTRHFSYMNFTKLNLPRPIYMNLVRDPVERVISWHYYIRSPWYLVLRKQRFPDISLPRPEWFKKDFETCVLTGDSECTFEQGTLAAGSGHMRQTLFFCGHSRNDCAPFNSIKAMQIAKRNVEQDYAVVGSWEDTNITLTVLEHYIPRYFRGALQTFQTKKDFFIATNKNKAKPSVSDKVKDMVRRNFTNEIEFYQFCKQRLYKQYLALRIDKNFK